MSRDWQDKTDSELVLAALAGETGAAEILVRRHEVQARRVALRCTTTEAAADEAMQAGFSLAFARLAELEDPTRFRPWLCAIVRNEAMNEHRRSALDLTDWAPGATGISRGSAVTTREARRRKRNRPERSGPAADLVWRNPQPVAHVAAALGIDVDTAQQLRFHARHRLGRGYLVHSLRANAPQPCQAFAGAVISYIRGTLDWPGRSAVEHHAAGCERCRRSLGDVVISTGALGVIPFAFVEGWRAASRGAKQTGRQVVQAAHGGSGPLMPAALGAIGLAAVTTVLVFTLGSAGGAPNQVTSAARAIDAGSASSVSATSGSARSGRTGSGASGSGVSGSGVSGSGVSGSGATGSGTAPSGSPALPSGRPDPLEPAGSSPGPSGSSGSTPSSSGRSSAGPSGATTTTTAVPRSTTPPTTTPTGGATPATANRTPRGTPVPTTTTTIPVATTTTSTTTPTTTTTIPPTTTTTTTTIPPTTTTTTTPPPTTTTTTTPSTTTTTVPPRAVSTPSSGAGLEPTPKLTGLLPIPKPHTIHIQPGPVVAPGAVLLPGNGSPADAYGSGHADGVWVGTPAYQTGPQPATQAFSFAAASGLQIPTDQLGSSDFTVSFELDTTTVANPVDLLGYRTVCTLSSLFDVRLGAQGSTADAGPGQLLVEFDGTAPSTTDPDPTDPDPTVTPANLVSSTVVADGSWHQVQITRVGTSLTLSVDGVVEDSVVLPVGDTVTNTATWQVANGDACLGQDGTTAYTGGLADLYIGAPSSAPAPIPVPASSTQRAPTSTAVRKDAHHARHHDHHRTDRHHG